MHLRVYEFEVGVNESIFSGNEQQKCKRKGSNCLTEFSLCTNYDSVIPLSFIHFGIPYDLKSTLQQTREISCVIEILFSLMYIQ